MIIRDAIERCTILNHANPASKTKILSYGIIKKYKKNEYIFRDREDVNKIYFVISGFVVLEKINKNQDRKIIFIFSTGELLNEVVLEESIASVSCYALGEVEIISFSRSQILEIMETDFQFSKMIMDSMAKKIRRLYHQLENTTNMMHLDKQIAAKLWKLGKDFGKEKENYIEIEFDMTITLLADMVGSKRETVSRIIKNMTNQKIVKINKNSCYIYDMNQLKKIVISVK